MVTILFAAWLIDTWTRGGLVRMLSAWWSTTTRATTRDPFDMQRAAEAAVAEAIGYTRTAAGEV